MKAFQKAWQSAVERIGQIQGKAYGTNPHAGRHYYGQRAADIGLDPRIRQIMMHHRSIGSQLRYQVPSPEQVDVVLEAAQRRILAAVLDAKPETGEDEPNRTFDGDDLVSLLSTTSKLTLNGNERLGGEIDIEIDPLSLMSGWKLYKRLG